MHFKYLTILFVIYISTELKKTKTKNTRQETSPIVLSMVFMFILKIPGSYLIYVGLPMFDF